MVVNASLAVSLRAQRSNPESFRGGILDCFVARAPRNDGARGTVVVLQMPLSFPRRRGIQ
ncbi:hypothetical protein EAS61_01130 [Bradyrhizobium zhanjiangense]|uniref:Uncharacterized protein n=1 Tax=Bradyrhizobium zhanjiangense TaxID=1325107 RepID=A0A4Q0R0X4_9BRAD|nr:hypothetical protein EAS61_01130 [Bradyrhizobium zhanjiangense]